MNLSDMIDHQVVETISSYKKDWWETSIGHFEQLISLGELIDRLTIINLKLYELKNQVANASDTNFLAEAATKDIYLVEERARLKKCIDLKIAALIDMHSVTMHCLL